MIAKEYRAPEAKLMRFDVEEDIMDFLKLSQNNNIDEVILEWK